MRVLLTKAFSTGFGIAFVAAWLSSCAPLQMAEDPLTSQRLDALTEGVEVGEPNNVLLGLSESIKSELNARVNPQWASTQRVEQLSEFFFNEAERNIQYDAQSTQSAEETYLTGRGNCLSMSSLFVAAARHLGIDAGFQTIEVRPTWAQSDEVMIRYEHIVAAGEVARDDYVVDFLPEVFGGRGKAQSITDEQALALYYSNMAVEALISGDAPLGIAKSLQAAKLWRDNANIWSNLGVAYRRYGQLELAELTFKRALLLDRGNYSALSNLTYLFVGQGRLAEVEQYLSTVARYNRRNPYYHYNLAQMQVALSNVVAASESLRHAAQIRQDDPVLLEAIAILFKTLGDLEASEKTMERAERLRRKLRSQRQQEEALLSPYPEF